MKDCEENVYEIEGRESHYERNENISTEENVVRANEMDYTGLNVNG